MEIVHTDFEKALKLNINGHDIEVVFWKTDERDNFKLGVEMQALKVENERLRKELKERDGAISDYGEIIKRNNAKIHSLHRALLSTLSPSPDIRYTGMN